jgi:hypothetical protein
LLSWSLIWTICERRVKPLIISLVVENLLQYLAGRKSYDVIYNNVRERRIIVAFKITYRFTFYCFLLTASVVCNLAIRGRADLARMGIIVRESQVLNKPL